MKKILTLLLFPLMMFAQDTTILGDLDCDGDVDMTDAQIVVQLFTGILDYSEYAQELDCVEDNITGLMPDQLQEIINMLDSELSISYSGGGSSNYPAMISSVSSEPFSFGEIFVYCNDLEEGGYDDWFVPNIDQLTYAISGGCEFPDERTNKHIWSRQPSNSSSGDMYYVFESDGGINATNASTNIQKHCRCVRFEEGETSEGSSGSSNSSSSSILGNSEQPITMIGPMYLHSQFPNFSHTNLNSNSPYPKTNLSYYDAIRFCGQLEYNGYDDWFVPSVNQILNYYADNDKIVIPNLAVLFEEIPNADTYKSFWTTENGYGSYGGVTNSRRNQIGIYLPGESIDINAEGWTLSDVFFDVSYMITGLNDASILSNTIGNINSHGCVCVR